MRFAHTAVTRREKHSVGDATRAINTTTSPAGALTSQVMQWMIILGKSLTSVLPPSMMSAVAAKSEKVVQLQKKRSFEL
eukprot:m.167588 g.167588  ORF g.167588 m.167588 type:complete len:79 (+) comp14735_c0_seq6:959-1195(+)